MTNDGRVLVYGVIFTSLNNIYLTLTLTLTVTLTLLTLTTTISGNPMQTTVNGMPLS